MAEPHSTDPSAHIQLVVDLLARSLNRAVLLDDTAMTPMTFSRQHGPVDDVRMHSLLERTTKPEVMAELRAFGADDADPGVAIPPLPEHGMVARYCVPVRSAGDRFGYLWVIDPQQSLSASERALAHQAGADLVAILDRRQTSERAVESAHHALLTRLLSAGVKEPLDPVLRELSAHDMAQPDSLLSVFAFVPSADSAGPSSASSRCGCGCPLSSGHTTGSCCPTIPSRSSRSVPRTCGFRRSGWSRP